MMSSVPMPAAGRAVHRLLVPALLIGAFLLTGCEGEDSEFALDLAKSWAQEKGLITAAGEVNLLNIGVLYAKQAFLGTTGDSDIDAALRAGEVAQQIREADALSQKGAQMGGARGVAEIDKAIAMRPDDWSYWEQRGALLTAEGRIMEAEQAFIQSRSLVSQHVQAGGDCRMYARNLLTQREQALLAQIDRMYAAGQQPPDHLIDRLDSVRAELGLLYTSAGQCG